MSGRPDAYPIAVREYVISEVCDHGRKLKPTIEALNRGEVEPFGVVPVGYSTAQNWIVRENQLRDATAPLEPDNLDAFVQRLWGVAGAELRKLERDSRKSKPIDAKRLNELEGFAARCRRHLARDPGQPPVAQDDDAPESMLDRLAREDRDTATQDRPSAAASTPTNPIPTRTTSTARTKAADSAPTQEDATSSPVQVAA